MVKIVTDSTCDIPEDLIKKFGITTVPIIIVFGTETYRERIDITPEQFYKRLVESKVHPTTAMQTPAAIHGTRCRILRLWNHNRNTTCATGIKAAIRLA